MAEKLSVADVLEHAADLIEPEGKWTQGAFSRNEDGTADLDEDQTAASNPVCWCGLGALAKVVGADPLAPYAFSIFYPERSIAGYNFLREFVGGDFASWNDAPGRTQAEVVAKLREAAALAREQGL